MLAEDGAAIEVPRDIDAGTLLLVSLATDPVERPVALHPRHSVQIMRGASLTLVEIAVGDGGYLNNPVFSITVAEDAKLTHLRLQDESPPPSTSPPSTPMSPHAASMTASPSTSAAASPAWRCTPASLANAQPRI